MNWSDLLKGMADEVVSEESDFELSEDDLHAIKTYMESQDPETLTMQQFLGGLGQVVDGFLYPAGMCILAMWRFLTQ